MTTSIYHKAILTGTIPSDEGNKRPFPVSLQGAVYSSDGELVFNSLRRCSYAGVKHVADSYIHPQRIEIAGHIDEHCRYIGHYHAHFGHFLIETLPELVIGAKTGKKIVAHSFMNQANALISSFSQETLSLLQLKNKDIVLIKKKNLLCKSLEVSLRVTSVNSSISPTAREAYQYISGLVKESSVLHEKIYLSRSKVLKRPSPTEVDQLMKSRGYYIYHPQEHSLIDQISLIKGAKEIAGYDGSALHLSVFMKPMGKISVLDERKNRNTEMINQLMEHHTEVIKI